MKIEFEELLHDNIIDAHMTLLGRLVGRIFTDPDVREAKNKAIAANIPWTQILAAVIPYAMQAITTGVINWQGIVAAITALILKPSQSL